MANTYDPIVTGGEGKLGGDPALQEVPLPEAADLEADLAFLEQVRWFRMALSERICAASAVSDEKVLHTLRLEPASQMAEFFFSLACFNISTPDQLDRLAELHNGYVVTVSKDKDKMVRLGLNSDRLLAAMFTADTRPRLIENWRDRPGAIDQSNLARFLGIVMSAETCRKTIVACGEAAFFQRWRTTYGTSMLCSTGVIEKIYGETLREARMSGRT